MTFHRDERSIAEWAHGSFYRRAPLARIALATFWIILVATFWGLDTLSKLQVRAAWGVDPALNPRLIAAQVTSAVAVLVLIPWVLWAVRRFQFSRVGWWMIPAHLAGYLLFSIGHYSLMVGLRAASYPLLGLPYMLRQNHLGNLAVEIQKDAKIYLSIVLIATFLEMRRRAPNARHANKLSLPTNKGERLVPIADIDYLEAAGNYVRVFADGERYLLRSTLTALADQLPQQDFIRVHRSYLVNGESVEELRTDGSRCRLLVRGGGEVPVSRGYVADVRRAVEKRSVR